LSIIAGDLCDATKRYDLGVPERMGTYVIAEQKGHEVLTQRLLGRIRGYLKEMEIPDDHGV
jgi:hypothetical protein